VKIANFNLVSSSETGIDHGRNEKLKKKCTHLIQLNVRKPLVECNGQGIEELRLYNLVQDLTISNSGLKAVSSDASLD
jgi:hypothetical protein